MSSLSINKQGDKNERTFHDVLTFQDYVVEKIAAVSARSVEGVLDLKGGFTTGLTNKLGGDELTNGVSVEVGEKQVAIDLTTILAFGYSAPLVFKQIAETVKSDVQHITGLEVIEVNVQVDDVMTVQEFTQQKVSSQTRELQ